MKDRMNLIVMLTYDDRTVPNAFEVFESCKDAPAEIWGIKEMPLPEEEMSILFDHMKRCGKKTALEVVSYTKEEGIKGAKTAMQCGCDILMGTVFSEEILAICRENNIQYMPFAGEVSERPSVLNGTIGSIIADAAECVGNGADGIDLLGYRYAKDPVALIKEAVNSIGAKVCVAGSVNSYERLEELCSADPWAFTVGSALFDHRFGNTVAEQIENIIRFIEESENKTVC